MSGKRKPYLTNSDRLNISDKLDQGESSVVIANEFNISSTSVLRIKKNKEKLRALALSENTRALEKKSLRTTNLTNVENALSVWFHQKRKLGEPISGPILVEKALLFNEKLNGPASFKASNGWVEKFKKRHGIRQLSIKGEKLFSNTEDAENFKKNFKKYIAENGYILENVYNADETGWNWRSLPREALADGNENEAPGRKINKERVTVMFCANAAGTHKIPALVIGECKKPSCFKNVTCLPVIYKAQSSAWMNRILFMEWFKESFIPLVTKEQEETNRRGKVLLILDNAPSHPAAEELNAINKDFTVMYLPANVAELIQPMKQGVIETAKRIYKHSLARRILMRDDQIRIEEFIKHLNLKDCCEMVSTAWGEVSSVSLRKAWNKLIEPEAPLKEEKHDANDISDEVMFTTINDIPGCSASASDIVAWIHEEDSEQTSVLLDDNEIANLVTENLLHGSLDEEAIEEMQANKIPYSGPTTPQDVIDGITAAYKWFEAQPVCTTNDLIVLNKIRRYAVNASIST